MTSSPSDAGLSAAALRAFGAGLVGAGIWVGVAGPLGLTVGLLVIAIFVGWLIGSSARSSTRISRQPPEGRVAERSSPAVRRLAVAAAGASWLVALFGVYVYSLAVIPDLPGEAGAGVDLWQRMRETSILAFYAQSFGPLDVIEAAVLVVTAWWSAR